jgi:hypothetical protein
MTFWISNSNSESQIKWSSIYYSLSGLNLHLYAKIFYYELESEREAIKS